MERPGIPDTASVFNALVPIYIRKWRSTVMHSPTVVFVCVHFRTVHCKKIKSLFLAMAKFVIVAVLLLAAVAASAAAPTGEFETGEALGFEGQGFEEEDDHLRFRRVTCDLLSFGGVVGDSACAANCLSMGKAGGSCNGGICECRKTTFKDLWDKRFG